MSGGNKIPKPVDISTDNIIKPSFDELSEEYRQAYEAYKKKHDEEELDKFVANFNKERLGNITAVGDTCSLLYTARKWLSKPYQIISHMVECKCFSSCCPTTDS